MTAGSRRRWQLLAVFSCALGMACKESMVTAPVIVALFDRVFLFDSFAAAWRARWRLYLGLAATWLLLAALLATGPRPHSAGFSSGLSPWTYLLNQPEVITRYLTLVVWPRSLVLLYGWPREVTLREALPYVAVVLVLVALTLLALRFRPKIGFLAVCFWVMLAPTSSVIPIATEVAAERRMYLPLAALVLLGAVGVVRIGEAVRGALRADPRRARLVTLTAAWLLTAVSGALASATVARNEEYSSAVVMARTVLDRHPTPIGHLMLARALLGAGQRSEAMRHLEQALPAPGARFTLGIELLNEGRLDEGMAHLRAFVADQRPFLEDVIVARLAMGHVLMDGERWPQAEREFRMVLDTLPNHAASRQQLAEALFAQGLWEEAIVQYRAYLAQMPNDAGVLNNYGIALGTTGKLEEAKMVFRRVLEIDPANGPAERNLAGALLVDLNFSEALTHAQRAVALQPDDAGSRELLGRILLRFGRLNEAADQFKRALAIDPTLEVARGELELLDKARGAR